MRPGHSPSPRTADGRSHWPGRQECHRPRPGPSQRWSGALLVSPLATEVPGRRSGLFVIDLDGAMVGMVTLDRRGAERPGHVRPEGEEAELGYLLLPEVWGCGYAAEACAAALGWFADAHPGEPVVLCTQTANERALRLAMKLGFTEVERFEEYDAEQWFGVWAQGTPAG
ncbi:GNAT family N-acetyltransferase [Streptomyces tibetensis]|uniref:GNAT family N-acetyltransferase n=1 Tax=Streptomyces tibetensis TaxID=2382123 RepID=UPI003F4D37CA